MLFIVSWRNIWRNKVRSLVILIAIIIGVFAGAFSWAFYSGMAEQRVKSAISTEASHIQIHHRKYLSDPDPKYYLTDVAEMKKEIEKDSLVKAVSSRIIVNAMVNSARTGSGVRLLGIQPEREKNITDVFTKIVEGAYFGPGIKHNPIVIGSELAKKLKVKVKSTLFLTFQQMDGSLVKDAFRVAGIYKTSSSAFDEFNIFVRSSDLSRELNFKPDCAHEIAIRLTDDAVLDVEAAKLKALFPGDDVETWRDIMPEVSLVEETMDISMIFFLAIILLGLLFGIINTMLMAVLDRTRELGMLMAVGMNKFRVFRMIMLETVLLSATGGVLGIFVATAASLLAHHTGISLAAWSKAYEKLGYDTMVYPVINMKIIGIVTLMVVITGIIAAVFPAFKALKLKPAEAIRTDV